MNFASDNVVGASAPVMEALRAANEGAAGAYGADPLTARVTTRLCEIFEREVAVHLVATGTAANALALACLCPPWGAVLTHDESHVADDECGAPEFFSHGAKLVGLPGVGGKIALPAMDAALKRMPAGVVKQVQPAAVSITQATEAGLVHSIAEIEAVAEAGRPRGLKLHMDGARFANALVALGCSPAEMTWKAGVDVLSFGATKNGCLAAEAVIVFDPKRLERENGEMPWRRKRGGHTLSKGRLLSAQLEGYLADDHWLANARAANAAAARLSAGLAALPGVRLAWPTEANEVFPILPLALHERLKAKGFAYHPWGAGHLPAGETVRETEILVRLVTSFATTNAEVDALLREAGAAASDRARAA